jgi:carbonic anhydrase
MNPTPRSLRLLPLVVALLGACALPAARAAEHAVADQPAPAKPKAPAADPAAQTKPGEAKVAAAPEPKVPAVKPVVVDPLDQLREKLAQKLGANKSTESRAGLVMQVSSRESGEMTVAAKAATRPSAPRVNVAALAAAHASTKEAGPADAHWSYSGETGPQAWGAMNSEFNKCSTGTRQSPIDIREGIAVELEPVQFDYRTTGFAVIDNGHTVQVNLAQGNAIQVLGRRYDLVQFHFHRPSEERINGRQFDMVAHLVHKDPEGRLAVVAVLLDRGSAQPIVQTIWNNLPLEKGEEQAARVAIDLNHLLPQDRRYYTYMGSLTTPPCSEGVLWMVMQQPVPISPEQIDIFARLYPMNARPVQAAAGRLIKQSN